ncbi:N-acetyldiaminopimelate deacetylase [Halalkalibacillus halophilus]|uniref:N-acetyldiaminopimelate deacetylase n=1 Tax=Halalkalibacillus halophilus TaxID=392827 RepID=UPI00042415B7|nr:N-acetyldiaminopimelate deacetylase [Halalkalibacillus halophilus]
MNLEQLIKIRRELHQIPELGFEEYKTQAYILEFLKSLNKDFIQIDTWRTGVFVYFKGTTGNETIAYRTDMDGLPITEQTGYDFASEHNGKMHACGHDFHMTIALGVITELAESPPENNVLFIFQPAEEGPGGALPIIQEGILAQYQVDYIFALHIDPRQEVGSVSSKPGLLFANTSELFIDFNGTGGHAAYPHETKDMMMAASAFNLQVQQIVSRATNPLEDAVVTLGKMEAGTVQNIIPEKARVEGTIRTSQPQTMQTIQNAIEKMLEGIEIRYECETELDYGSNYYMVNNTEVYTEKFEAALQNSSITYRKANAAMTGEDFGYFLKEYPGFMFWLGVGADYGLHQSKLNPDERALEIGVEAVKRMIKS